MPTNTGNYQRRDKFFYASPTIFKSWPYKSRLAIGMKLDDFAAVNAGTYNFLIKGKLYSISSTKARLLGNLYKLKGGSLPNLIPLEEWEVKDVG